MNWNMIGHEWAVQLLKQHIIQNTQRQAYLITGPESVGRRTLALRFAQAVNCPQPTEPGEPCLDCSTCGQIERMIHPDLTVVEADRVGGQLKVDQIRGLQHGLSLAPYDAKYRIALLLRFEEANRQAANALLKTLEEPPPQVILMLTAESADRLLPTIVSRCEVIRLRPTPLGVIKQGLQTKWQVPPAEADLLTHLSSGRPGYTFQLYQNPGNLSLRRTWLDELINLLSANRVERFEYAETLAKDANKLRDILKVWLAFWRDVMLRSSKSSSQITNIDYQDLIDQLANNLGQKKAHNLVVSVEQIFDHLDHNVNPRLALEVFMLDLPKSKVSSSTQKIG
jgi:DNA polymerase-3 subunit delta'